MKRVLTVFMLAAWCAAPALADEELMSLDDLLESFGWDLATTEIKSEKLGEGLYVLFGIGGNIGVSIGDDGTLIVDDQFPELMPKIEAAIAKLGGDGVDFAINTHWHFDHAEGNLALGPSTALCSRRSVRPRSSTTKESRLLNRGPV